MINFDILRKNCGLLEIVKFALFKCLSKLTWMVFPYTKSRFKWPFDPKINFSGFYKFLLKCSETTFKRVFERFWGILKILPKMSKFMILVILSIFRYKHLENDPYDQKINFSDFSKFSLKRPETTFKHVFQRFWGISYNFWKIMDFQKKVIFRRFWYYSTSQLWTFLRYTPFRPKISISGCPEIFLKIDLFFDFSTNEEM